MDICEKKRMNALDWLKDWIKRKWKAYVVWSILLLSFNLYFICLMKTTQITYLLYLDLLLLVFLAVVEGTAFFRFLKKEHRKKKLLQEDGLIYEILGRPEDRDVFEHDIQVLDKRLQNKFDENCELQDYVAKWCHEFKLPLAAALLLSEKIKDTEIRTEMRAQLERMNWQMSMMMQGCRLQSPLFDLQVKQVPLEKCVRASIKNNQFFLIQKKFQIIMDIDEAIVYTDEAWLTYMLDQILNNAVKYAKPDKEHCIRFSCTWAPSGSLSAELTGARCTSREETFPARLEKSPEQEALIQTESFQIKLFIEDNGEGIRESDIRRIFEKGYTGSNYHNGKYKSTGMGLYMADKIAKRLEHDLTVESRYGEYTRFCIVLRGYV